MKKLLAILLPVCLISCAYHQEMYKQPGYFTYEHNRYRFHPADTLIYIPSFEADTAKLFYQVRIVNIKGKQHWNYVNNQ